MGIPDQNVKICPRVSRESPVWVPDSDSPGPDSADAAPAALPDSPDSAAPTPESCPIPRRFRAAPAPIPATAPRGIAPTLVCQGQARRAGAWRRA
jgi:hypothetical protein